MGIGSRGLSSDTAATWFAVLDLLWRDDLEPRKLGDLKGSRHHDVRGVTTASHNNAADAGWLRGVDGVPSAIERDFGPRR